MHRRPRPSPSRRRGARPAPHRPPLPPGPAFVPDRLPGAHELGQNRLRDPRTIGRIVRCAAELPGGLVEWGAGDGALTLALLELGRPLEAIEIDPRAAGVLERRARSRGLADLLDLRREDLLRHVPPPGAIVVSNLPFHLTTPALQHLLGMRTWRRAVLVTQWEVARKRAAVGGTSLLSAQWWPWYRFALQGRIPRSAFRPVPSVDAGLLLVDRREVPTLPPGEQVSYQRFVRRVFTGPGRGLAQVLQGAGLAPAEARRFCARHGYAPTALPRAVDPAHWVDAHAASRRP